MLAEVESLLSSLDGAESFLEMPAIAKVADVIEAETKTLEIGKYFRHFEIIEQIGAGGMGKVYLAEDKKLDRQVAVKILNEKFSGEKLLRCFRRFNENPERFWNQCQVKLNKSEPPLPRRF